ncbi:hypothetical protein RDI58_004196 [Solanum bulbocastanum]|uniref:Uncharacterized protein n=1 Tax=Solanum bulbocastanum TaxID=147425 RepID=A0AAN8YL29_SOLBU
MNGGIPAVMYLSTHQKTCENPKFQQLKKKIEEIEIENLREGVVKISNSELNVPLSEIQNSTLQQHLDRFLSDLCTIRFIALILGLEKIRMIEKALQELDEEGDSNEDSIFEFINKRV